MRFAVFGLTVTSSWGNGHATTWRGVLRELAEAGHQVTFFERDVPYYAVARDLPEPDFCDLVLYQQWEDIGERARRAVRDSDVALVTSYCADGLAACDLVLDAPTATRVFYDIDTPVTLGDLDRYGVASASGARYLTPDLIPQFDLYLSFTGGPTLRELRERWGARRVAPLYCSADPAIHHPVPPMDAFRCQLGYLGTYAADRQPALERILVASARKRPAERFIVAGPQYPPKIQWPPNVSLLPHLAPDEHPSFYCSSRVTLNVTRAAMVQAGYSPSVRLFEAALCGVPIVSDAWPGLETFFTPGEEIVVVPTGDAEPALSLSDHELRRIAEAARERTLRDHTAAARARELVAFCEAAAASRSLVGAPELSRM